MEYRSPLISSAAYLMPSGDHARLPARIEGPDELVVRLWEDEDAEGLGEAVRESQEHLRPWMAWAAAEPLPLPERLAQIARWRHDWEEGRDAFYGTFVGGRVAGGCGFHRRIAEDGLEIGYWIHPRFLRRGWATRTAALLTDAALALPDITHVEIHHDAANRASGGVPRKLGFRFIGETRREPEAPADAGIEHRWRVTREDWNNRGAAQTAPL